MLVVMLNIPEEQLWNDEYEMPLNEWLMIATDESRDGLNRKHGAICTSGMRLHADITLPEYQEPCDCCNESVHKKIDFVTERAVRDSKFIFAISRDYLKDIISGMNPDDKMLLFFHDGNPAHPVVVRDNRKERLALVMPMNAIELDKTLKIPTCTNQDE